MSKSVTWTTASFYAKWKQPSPQREAAVVHEILSGNVPENMFDFQPVADFEAMCDYLMFGPDGDRTRCPLTPYAVQYIADYFKLQIPLPHAVDLIWQAAPNKLIPNEKPWNYKSPICGELGPSFLQHSREIDSELMSKQMLGESAIVAGQKKDVVGIPVRGCVSIYGWHRMSGIPIQPLYSHHGSYYADYSHGIRFIRDASGKHSGKAYDEAYPKEFLAALKGYGI